MSATIPIASISTMIPIDIRSNTDFTTIPNKIEKTIKSFLYSFFTGLKKVYSSAGTENSDKQ